MKTMIQYFLSAMLVLAFSTATASAVSLTPSTAHVLGSSDGLGVAHSNALVDTEGGNDNGPYGLSSPLGMDIDPVGHRLFVAEKSNDRVMVFQLDNNNNIASRKAIAVLGQADFDHTSSNREAGANASSMNGPEGVGFYDDGVEQWLLVADGINDRVLIYNITAGISNGMAAVTVLGQTSFAGTSSSRRQNRLSSPSSARVLDFGIRRLLFVADETNDRTMVWDVSAGLGALVNGNNADFVLGQPNFTTNGASTSATTNDGTVAFAQWGNVLFVSENFDHRIIGFDLGVNAANLVNGMAATYLLGQTTFSGKLSDRGVSTRNCCNGGSLDNPGALAVSGDHLFAVDSDNRRVLVYDLNQFTTSGTIANGMEAVYVYGQSSLAIQSTSRTSQNRMSGPWGLALAGNNLFVSDEFDDRITSFDLSTLNADIAAANFSPNAVDAIGQTTTFPGKADGTESVVWNAEGSNDTGPVGMQDPGDSTVGVVGGITYLFMTDRLNNRVLAFEAAANGTPVDLQADFVLGQPNFDVDDIGTSATTMDDPRGVVFDAATSNLFVSDTDNDRVLVFDLTAGISNGMAAVVAIGQASLTVGSSSRTQSRLNQPRKLTLGTVAGIRYLFVADKTNDRIMLFNISDGASTGELAAHVLGGPNFTQNFSGAAQNKLSNPEGVEFDQANQRLFVADDTADRVLVWELAAGITDGMNASFILGQSSWTATSSGLSASEFNGAYDMAYDSARDILWVVDHNNHRITGFDLSGGIINNMNASYVIGQSNFTSGSWQKGAARTAYTTGLPAGISIGSDGNLIVGQWDDDRAVVFGGSFLPPTVNVGGDSAIDEGATFSRAGSFTDSDPVDSWSATVDYGDGSGLSALTLNPNKSFDLSHAYANAGVYPVEVIVEDSGAATGTGTFSVTVGDPLDPNPNPAPSDGSFIANGVLPVDFSQSAGVNGSWHVASDFATDGAFSLRSDAISHNQTAAIETIASSSGRVSFDYKVSSEQRYDFFEFYINGVRKLSISGEIDWQRASFAVLAGDVLKWAYIKDRGVIRGLDSAWIDKVVIGPVVVTDIFPADGVIPVGWSQSAGADGSWLVAGDFSTEGAFSLSSDVISHNQTAAIETIASSAGTVSFDYKVSSERSYDFFEFYVNGVRKILESGEIDWQSASFPVLAGDVLKWVYIKDRGVIRGLDAAWIDNVVLPVAGAINALPVANDDAASVDEDASVIISVLTNDTDADGDTLRVIVVSAGTNGGTTLNDDGSIAYTPNANTNGNDSFTYDISDGNGGTDTATVNITVNPVNDAPVVNAGADSTINVDPTFSGSGSFTDPDTDSWTATVNYGDGTGSSALNLNADKSFSLSHVYADNGSYTVTVIVTDNNSVTGSDSLIVTVANVVTGDTEAPVILDVLADVTVVARIRGGYVRLPRTLRATDNVDGALLASTDHRSSIYPVGLTVVTYTARDAAGNTATATVNVNVTEIVVSDTEAPVIQGVPADVILVARPRGGYVRLPRVLNATDNVDGTVVANTNHRSSIYPLGLTVVTYIARDAAGNVGTATVNVTVIDPSGVVPAPAPAPVVIGDTEAPVIQGVPADVTLVARPRGGYVRLPRVLRATDNVDGTVAARTDHRSSIYPVGTTVVTYTAIDSSGNTSTATVNVIVTPAP